MSRKKLQMVTQEILHNAFEPRFSLGMISIEKSSPGHIRVRTESGYSKSFCYREFHFTDYIT
jgi:hypothetical protein